MKLAGFQAYRLVRIVSSGKEDLLYKHTGLTTFIIVLAKIWEELDDNYAHATCEASIK